MKPLSTHSRIGHDTTPATHGDLEIWGGRIMDKIEESAEEVKSELRAELKMEIHPLREQIKNNTEQLAEVKDRLYDMSLLLKSVAKKVLGK